MQLRIIAGLIQNLSVGQLDLNRADSVRNVANSEGHGSLAGSEVVRRSDFHGFLMALKVAENIIGDLRVRSRVYHKREKSRSEVRHVVKCKALG